MKKNLKTLLIALGIPLAVGGLATLLSGGMGNYRALEQPPLSPPGFVFPIVWTLLYLLMGYSSYRVYTSNTPEIAKKRALTLYVIQLALNFLWPIVFFGFEWYLAAFFVLPGLWVAILLTMRSFSAIDESNFTGAVPGFKTCRG